MPVDWIVGLRVDEGKYEVYDFFTLMGNTLDLPLSCPTVAFTKTK